MDPLFGERLFTAVANCEGQALMAWRKQHFPAEDLTDALGLHVKTIRTTLERHHGGKKSVVVLVKTRQVRYEEAFYFHLQSLPDGGYFVGDCNLS